MSKESVAGGKYVFSGFGRGFEVAMVVAQNSGCVLKNSTKLARNSGLVFIRFY